MKKLTLTQKLMILGKKDSDYDHSNKYVTTPQFNRLTVEKFAARLRQENLASKSDIANFVNETDFNNKIKYVTSNKNELNELSRKFKAISTKGLTKDLINRFSVLNGGKYFSLGIFQKLFIIYNS